MCNEFFKKIDEEIGKLKEQKIQEEQTSEDQRNLAIKLVESLSPLLERYKKNLEERGIRTEIFTKDDYFSFKMFYSDGGHRGFELRNDTKKYEMVRLYTNDDGRDKESSSGVTDLNTYTVEHFEKMLQHDIKDFIFYAPRHGGYESESD